MKCFALSLLTLIPHVLYSYDDYPEGYIPEYAYSYTCDYTDDCYTDGYTQDYTSNYTSGYVTVNTCYCYAVRNQEYQKYIEQELTHEEIKQIQNAMHATQILVLAPACTIGDIGHQTHSLLKRICTTVHDSSLCQELIDKIRTLLETI